MKTLLAIAAVATFAVTGAQAGGYGYGHGSSYGYTAYQAPAPSYHTYSYEPTYAPAHRSYYKPIYKRYVAKSYGYAAHGGY